jgi:hypothetical protein
MMLNRRCFVLFPQFVQTNAVAELLLVVVLQPTDALFFCILFFVR